MNFPQTLTQMELSFCHQEESSSFCSIGSNPSTCSTHTNLSHSVELALGPLIDQLVSPGSKGDKKQRNVSLSLLLQSMDQGVSQLVNAAEKIAYENDRKIQMKMLGSVNRLKTSAKQFKLLMSDPTSPLPPPLGVSPSKTPSPRDAARVLLYDLAAVLSVADMLDMKRMHEATHSVESSLESLKSIVSVSELFQQITLFTPVMAKLTRLAKQRQDDLETSRGNLSLIESLCWYRRVLAIGCAMLISSCRSYVKHPDLETARSNRDFSFEVILEASTTISRIVREDVVPPGFSLDTGGVLFQQISSLHLLFLLPPEESTRYKQISEITQLLRQLIDTALSLTELVSTRHTHSVLLNQFCLQANQHLTDTDLLLSRESEIVKLCDCLCHAVDLSNLDALLDLYSLLREPLQEILSAVKTTQVKQVQEAFDSFFQLMERILQVSENISSSCSDPQATRLIKLSSDQLTRLATQLSSSARSCWLRPRSRAAWGCFQVVRQLWEQELTLLLDTLDSVTSLSDFLSVVELHLQQHLTDCIAAVEKCHVIDVVACKTGIETVSTRLLCIVEGFLTHGDVVIDLETQQSVSSMVSVLRAELYRFNEEMNVIELSLSDSQYKNVKIFRKITDKIYELVVSIKDTLMLVISEELSECEYTPDNPKLLHSPESREDEMRKSSYRRTSRSHTPLHTGIDTEVQVILSNMSLPEKTRLASARQEFHLQQIKLETAVNKWDETENDVIFLAKEMCVMMMDMSDFTKGEGPIHRPQELIETAGKLAYSSHQLESLITAVIENCHDENIVRDLQAYLSEAKLYAHQIKMTSKVYSDVSSILRNTDSMSSIVMSSKNLLDTVVKLVMSSYIACCKAAKSVGNSSSSLHLLKWKILPPSKKPLCRSSSAYSLSSNLSRPGTSRLSSATHIPAPIQVLDEFQVQSDENTTFL